MSKYLCLGRNRDGRDFVCGDIHGMFDLLDEALEALRFDPARDRLLALGDLIDRGERSADYAHYLAKPWFYAIMGNHEAMACAAIDRPSLATLSFWLDNGGDWFDGQQAASGAALLADLRALPLALEAETRAGHRIGLTHAEMPDLAWDALSTVLQQHPGDAWDFEGDRVVTQLLWARRLVHRRQAPPVAGIDHVFHGHTPVAAVKRLANRSWVDLGAYRTGTLCVLEVDAYLQSGRGP